jgi:hypothetical protein
VSSGATLLCSPVSNLRTPSSLRRACRVLIAVALLSLTSATVKAEVIATDDASNYSGFTGSENFGSGFGSWVKRTDLNAGTFLDNSSADIRTGGKSWGLFANTANQTNNVVVYRPFNTGLAVGNTFSIKLDNNSITSGTAMGFVLKSNTTSANTGDYNNGARFEYLFVGGDTNYSYVDNTGRQSSGVPFRSSGMTLFVVVSGTNTFNLYINDAAGTTSLGSVTAKTMTGSGTITSFDIYNRDTDNDQYFNSVTVFNPEYTGGAGNWSTAGNWLTSNKVLDGNNVIFSGAGGAAVNDLSNANANFGNVQQINLLTFKAGAGAYTLSGNALNINGGITNSSSNLQTTNINLTLGAAQTFAGGASGMQFGSAAGAGNGAINNNGFLLTTSGTNTFNGIISGSGGLTVSASSTTTLKGTNTYGGLTTVTGTLEINNTGTTTGKIGGTSSVTMNSGGTLLLSGSNTVSDRINDSATMTLNGGKLNTGGLSEGSTSTAGIGALTLQDNSIIDLGAGASILHFAASNLASWVSGKILEIDNWSGSQSGGGVDQLIFGSNSSGLTSQQIAEVQFLNPAGFSAGTYGAMILSNGELVPVPEPSTWIAGALVFGTLLVRQRRRFSRVCCIKTKL